MKLTNRQEALVQNIARLKVETTAKRTEFYAYQAQRESEFLASCDGPLHDAMYEAFKAGVPKTRIGQAYQSKDFATINGILKQYTDSTASHDAFTVSRDPDTLVYTVHVEKLANWSAAGDQGKVLRDATVQFTLDGYSIPTFLGEDPWGGENAPLARQIEMHAKSEHPLNVAINAKKEA